MRFIRVFFPFKHGPENGRRKKRRHTVYFGFYGREPRCVRKGINKRPCRCCSPYCNGVPFFQRDLLYFQQPPAKVRDGPEQEQHAKSRSQRTHGINKHGGLPVAPEHGKQPAKKLVSGISGRVTHLQFVRRCNEFTAIPETGCRFYCRQINSGRYSKDHPSDKEVRSFECPCFHTTNVGYFFYLYR